MIRYVAFLVMVLAASPGLAQTTQSPEEKEARLELLAGQSLFELGQAHAQLMQVKQQLEALKAKCGQPCAEPDQGPAK